jgi:hypothetical protein
MNTTAKTIWAVCIFSVAMAALESAVVVYLRALYYPEGFTVAFKLIDESIVKVELLREIATLVMLAAIGYIAGKNPKDRFAYFLLSFAVWDIFYYAWLKVLIDWPASLLDWDILFLIPFAWLGPVLAPLLCSITMIGLAIVVLFNPKPIQRLVWTLLAVGSSLILFTFLQDYGWIIMNNGFMPDYANLLRNNDFIKLASGYIPGSYNWPVFLLGEVFLLAGVFCQYASGSPRSRLDAVNEKSLTL